MKLSSRFFKWSYKEPKETILVGTCVPPFGVANTFKKIVRNLNMHQIGIMKVIKSSRKAEHVGHVGT